MMHAVHDAAWRVPRADIQILNPKRNRYVVIIGVLNEGERLHRQLAKLSKFLDTCDVVIADAPSTDGSTEPTILKAAGVHALVSLQEPGGLSSSLRTGFAYALRAGYEGLVIMDGNDKDDPSALPIFAEQLNAGVDYVQGSRFQRGGQAINTPLVRMLLIKLVHAPFFSVLCRVRLTDTTNGFRAYSRRFLLDARVTPFRDAFCFYELPFYLSWAACRYGFRTSEIPVVRAYPSTGPVPTKITGVRAHWRMLKPLLMLLLHRY